MNPSNANHNNANSKGNQEVLITEIHRQRSNDEMNTTADKDCDHASDDPSSVIGASLLPFLPPGRNEIRRSDRTDDATAHEFHSRSPKRRRDLEGNRQDHFHMEEDGDRNHGYVSPLLHGGVSTMGRNIPQQGNQQPPRQRRARTRLLLRGPPGSGKTSLAMNLAYTEAKKDSHLPSGCTSAIVYRPGPSEDSGSTIADSNRFPLFCRPLPKYFATESQTNTDKSRSNTVEGPNTVPIEKENQQEESWDPYTLSRIRICRVSSLRQLLEDILVLAGKPIEEQPTRAIIIEDLDAIIELEENTSSTPRNQIGNRTGKNTKNNRIVAAMLKTVAIVADTALLGKQAQLEYPSCPQSLLLLVTLTTTNIPLQPQRNPSMNSLLHSRRGVAMSGTDSSDFLAVASCIDTVVTLYERPRNIEKQNIGNNRSIEDRESEWMLPVSTTNRSSKATSKKDGTANNSSSVSETETIAVDSLWQAEIQEREPSQYDDNCNGDWIGLTSEISFVDYAFVESSLPTNEEDQHGMIGLGDEYDGVKELRWKQNTVNSRNSRTI